jgi:hypothetical protein
MPVQQPKEETALQAKKETMVPPAPPAPPPPVLPSTTKVPPAPPTPASPVPPPTAKVVVPPAPPRPPVTLVPPAPPKPDSPKTESAKAVVVPAAPPRPSMPVEAQTAEQSLSTERPTLDDSEAETDGESPVCRHSRDTSRDAVDSNASTKSSDSGRTAQVETAQGAGKSLRADVAAFDPETMGLAALGLTGTRAREFAKDRARLEDEKRWTEVLRLLQNGLLPA